jgi:GntR family transcriptional repressor for pyruvate dehydrogenase complex
MAEGNSHQSPALRFKPVLGSRPAEAICAQVRAKISSHALQIGDKLPTERDLSAQLKVSRNTVRQAMRSLAEMGLIDMRKGATGGAFIKGGDGAVGSAFTDLFNLGAIQPADLTEVRVLIGVEVARLACLRASDEEIDALEDAIETAESVAKEGDVARRIEINLEFHRMLSRMTHNPILIMLTTAVSAVTLEFVKQIGPTPARPVMLLRRRMLKHLRGRDAEGAADAMRDHLLRLQRLYLKKVATRPHNGSAG